ncbi:unannotated protein [freshwater metagenome]|uniref:Unannotated protein n=1 Tax=freshwater metagenome TaxID=449393 RepID=A0A6J6Y0I0_9ZZZZ
MYPVRTQLHRQRPALRTRGVDASTDASLCFQHRHLVPFVSKRPRSSNSGDTSTDDNDPLDGIAHVPHQ